MGTTITVAGASYSSFVTITKYPVLTGRTAYFQLGGSLEASLVNQGTGADATAINGAPGVSFNANSARFTGALNGQENSLQTSEFDNESVAVTFIAIARRTDLSTFRPMFGVFDNVPDGGSSITTNGATVVDGSQQVADWPYDAADQYIMYAGTYDGTNVQAFNGFGGQILAGTPLSAPGRVQQTQNGARIGGGFATSQALDLEMCMVAKHTFALTQEQLRQIYIYERQRLAAVGITLV